MKIDTTRFGTIDIRDEKVIFFPRGIMGFSNNKRFILFPHKEGSPFFWMQSVDDGALAFVVMNPLLVVEDFSVDIEEIVLEELETDEDSDIDVLCLVTIPRDKPDNMTINLLGPIVINSSKRVALQVISSNSSYSHRHPIIAAS